MFVEATCSSFKDMTMGTPLYALVCIALLSINFKNFRVHAQYNELLSKEKEDCFNQEAIANDHSDVTWMEKCVVKYFCLQPQQGQDSETFSKPQFTGELSTPYFEYAAKRIEKFFLRNPDWRITKTNEVYRAGNCEKLLAITDARYLYVTYVLFIQSDNKLTACKKDRNDEKFYLPTDVCFPRPYGSGTCTSDYDVGLIGQSSGELTVEFNKYFTRTFNKPSEEVFDTNVYAFTLEYAMPELFIGLTGYFKRIVPYLDLKSWYQMQELASAYFKMYKWSEVFYKEFVDYAEANLGGLGLVKSVPNRNLLFTRSIQKLKNWNNNQKEVKSINDLRNEHNKIYNQQVKEAEKHFDKRYYQEIAKYMTEMSVALVYAAEAYHTRGAMRHVVGGLQMKSPIVKATTTVMDYWVSMIENWADCNKEYKHCTEEDNVGVCLLKMSKYLYRTFDAMKRIYKVLSRIPNPANALRAAKLLPKYPSQHDPQQIALEWVSKFRGVQEEIPNFNRNIKPFLTSVGCSGQSEEGLHEDCMKKIQAKVMEYNKILVSATAKDAKPIQAIFTLMPNGKQKKAPP